MNSPVPPPAPNIDYAQEIACRYGAVKRARGHYLYTQSGVRLTDLWQEGGRAILGWGAGSALTVFKNTLNRAATGSLTNTESGRLRRALSAYIGNTELEFRPFIGAPSLKAAFESLYRRELPKAVAGMHTDAWLISAGIPVLRPWGETPPDPPYVVLPPLPWAGGFYIAAFQSDETSPPPGDSLPSPLLAAATRAFYDLQKTIHSGTEAWWSVYDRFLSPCWKREGPWLYPLIPREQYPRFFLHCLDLGILISPFYEYPSLVPRANPGDLARLRSHAPA